VTMNAGWNAFSGPRWVIGMEDQPVAFTGTRK
jgi:hypothetical protein